MFQRPRKIAAIIGVFGAGALGGIWSQSFLLPYFASQEFSRNWQFVRDWSSRTTIVREVHEIIITEPVALARAVENTQKATVLVEAIQGQKSIVSTGFISSADGVVMTSATATPVGSEVKIWLQGNDTALSAQLLKRDATLNLAILKMERAGLQPVRFVEMSALIPGKEVFAIERARNENVVSIAVEKGIIRQIGGEKISTDFERISLNGSPMFTLEGDAVGLLVLDAKKQLRAISAQEARSFLGF